MEYDSTWLPHASSDKLLEVEGLSLSFKTALNATILLLEILVEKYTNFKFWKDKNFILPF